jgi:hypothetical protein
MTHQARAAGVSLDLSEEVATTHIPITPDPNAPPNPNSGFTNWFLETGDRRVYSQFDGLLIDALILDIASAVILSIAIGGL